MSEDCDLCRLVKEKKDVIYEDDQIIAMLDPKPASAGHVIVMPKEHIPIIEQVPDPLVGRLFDKANKISSAAFEAFGSQGTNIIVQNGIAGGQTSAHMSIHIIPRQEGDGMNFQWAPKQLDEEEMSTIELILKQECEKIGGFEQEKEKPMVIEKKEEIISQKDDEVNYLIEQLKRIP
jgi:histidine triad (HIT) family protein